MIVIKRNKEQEEFNPEKIKSAIYKAFCSMGLAMPKDIVNKVLNRLNIGDIVEVEEIQNIIETTLMKEGYFDAAKSFILYREKHRELRSTIEKDKFIQSYIKAENASTGSKYDSNANVTVKNIATLNAELPKLDSIKLNRYRVCKKLEKLYGKNVAKDYLKDLEVNKYIYKHDETCSAIYPYCVAVNMYPFLLNGLKDLGGLSVAPKNIDSFCGMFVNLVFAISSQFMGAVAFGEFFNVFDYFARKEWGDDYYKYVDKPAKIRYIDESSVDKMLKFGTISIEKQIEQYFQQIVYSINQPAASRGYQSAFINFNYFDSNYWKAMFGEFVFPDGTKPQWESISWLQKKFMKWFNEERTKCILAFPVESMALLSNSKDIIDKEYKDFTAKMYAKGHSFFTYISDNADSLSSCCFSKDTKVLWKNSNNEVKLSTLEELHNMKWEPYKKNLRIFHNGSWVSGKSIKLDNKKMFKVVTENNKEFIMTDNHINVTFNGEKQTSELTTNDYLMFNTSTLEAIPENDEHLTYEMGFVIGAFLGDGSFGSKIKGTIYDINFSQNINKYKTCIDNINKCAEQLGIKSRALLSKTHNNVYLVKIPSKKLVAFIQKWTLWKRETCAHNKELNLNCLLQSSDFRRGILAGWYNTDGGNSNRCYTSSIELAEGMEALITSLGMNSIIEVSDRTDEKVVIRDQEWNRNYPLYCVRWYERVNYRVNKDAEHIWKKKNNSIFFKIKSIEEINYTDPVYCIECTNLEEPYFTLPSGLITHNCRLRNEVKNNEFSFTNGLTGVATGSKSVITLNLNRIIQDYFGPYNNSEVVEKNLWADNVVREQFTVFLKSILKRVYKYHTAYNELLKDLLKAKLLPVYDAGFISLKQQFLTIGINGLNEAAEFVGIPISDNPNYEMFCNIILSTISEQNKKHNTKELKFNTEFVPAESLGVKNAKWDKEEGYMVPRDCYNSYFYLPEDDKISILEKFRLHGRRYTSNLDGGVGLHCNLDEHLSTEQYASLIEYAIQEGTSYFTFNIPNTICNDCGHIDKRYTKECTKCGSKNIDYATRIIGYLKKITNFSKPRQEEAKKRAYLKYNQIYE